MKMRIFSLLLALLIFFSIPLTASADVILPDTSRTDCTIKVEVKYDGEPVDDGTLTCIRIAEVVTENGNSYFRRLTDGQIMTNVESRSTAKKEAELYEENKDYPYETKTYHVDDDGYVWFTNLKTGLYLIIQEEAADDFNALSPFLVSVPYMEDGQYVYNVDAAVKSELVREPEPEPTKPRPSGRLPQTGQLNWPVPILACGGLLLAAIGWFLRFGKKEETE